MYAKGPSGTVLWTHLREEREQTLSTFHLFCFLFSFVGLGTLIDVQSFFLALY